MNFTIGADGSAFAGALGKLQEPLNKIGQAFIGLQGIAAGLRTAFSAAMAPLQAYGELEDVKTQLSIMLNSEDAAERLTAALQSMATNGVVGMQDLVAAARSLARVLPQESIVTWVGRFADIAAASKVPAERLASMVARLNDMGKAEFTELANAGIPIFEALGEVTGKSAQELQKMSAEGKVGVHDLLAAFELLTDAGGKFHEMNSKMSGTTLGSIATMKAQWGELLAEIGKPIAEGITPVLKAVTDMMLEVKPVVAAVFEGLWSVVETVWRIGEAVSDLFVSVLQPVWALLGLLLKALVTGLEAIWGVVQKLVKGFEVCMSAVKKAIDALWGFFGVTKEADKATKELVTREQIAAGVAENRATAERRKAEAIEAAAEAAKKAAKVDDMVNEHFKKENEDRVMSRESGAARRQGLMELHGVKDEVDLWHQIEEIWAENDPSEQQIERLRELIALDRQLAKIKKEEAEAEKKAADAAAEAAKKEAEDRKRAEREFWERQDAAREAAWEKNTTLAEKRAWYFGAGSAQITPGEVTVAQVQADMEKLVAEDPIKYAGMIADMEKWLAKVRELEEAEAAQKEAEVNKRNSARVDVVQASLASVGGGGASIRMGDKQFREAQQHTKLLKGIKDAIAAWVPKVNGVAVLA